MLITFENFLIQLALNNKKQTDNHDIHNTTSFIIFDGDIIKNPTKS